MSFRKLNDEISPEFTQEVVYEILKKQTGLNQIKVTAVTIGDSSKKGDSYLSYNRKFTVEIVGETVDGNEVTKVVAFFVKYLVSNVARRKAFRACEFFRNEAAFYQKAWPILEQFRKSKGFTDSFEHIPKCYSAHIDGLTDYIALSDLTHEGFSAVTRSDGLDYDHTITILKAYANFHGLSLACRAQKKEAFQEAISYLEEVYFSEELEKWYGNYQKSLHVVVKDAIDKELSLEYSEKFDKLLAGDFYRKICELCKVDGKFSVITQGDAWIPNFLICYEDEKPMKAALVDLQIARYTSLSTDLTSFLYACVREEVLDKWDDLIAFYYKNLNENLERYGVGSLFSLNELQEDVKQSAAFGIGMAMEALLACLVDDADISDLDKMTGDQPVPLESILIYRPFKEQEKRSRVANMFKRVADQGFI